MSNGSYLELSEQSLNAYRERVRIRTEEKAVVQHSELTTILEHARDSSSRNYLLPIVGNSGFGKTVTCYQAMEEWSDSGPALRLEPADIQGATSLSQAIQSAFDRLYPTLNLVAGQDALRIARDTDRLLLVVDDLNRASDSSQHSIEAGCKTVVSGFWCCMNTKPKTCAHFD
ncbi:ATP-binding protein [Halocatena pleomorpha]|uniref:ATP-binding protein n=1 Tax=Halocatena pleomorpha TaxID=1785090 RepID=A0A3P3R4T2_9EURY|nr:ATP-binding protein [Halocatena pleomorpha]RRJ28497.1 ATP-binding protein [Halocatena pleomorpha]